MFWGCHLLVYCTWLPGDWLWRTNDCRWIFLCGTFFSIKRYQLYGNKCCDYCNAEDIAVNFERFNFPSVLLSLLWHLQASHFWGIFLIGHAYWGSRWHVQPSCTTVIVIGRLWLVSAVSFTSDGNCAGQTSNAGNNFSDFGTFKKAACNLIRSRHPFDLVIKY